MNQRTSLSSPEWEDRIAELVEQYKSEWRALVKKIAPPDASSFVSGVEPPRVDDPQLCSRFREQLLKALASVDEDYRHILEPEKPDTKDGAAGGTDNPAPSQIVLAEDSQVGEPDASSPTVSYTANKPDRVEEFPDFDPFAATGEWGRNENGVSEPNPSASTGVATDFVRSVIPGYRIEGVLGKGGMGVVYRARQIGVGRAVALKMVLDKRQADPVMIARFQKEAEALGRLDHENIVRIYEIGTAEGLPYFSLEFIDGTSLEEEWNSKPMEPKRAASIVETLSSAMADAHAAGIVHRDLKPANVLVAKDGKLKVTDFGLVKRIEEDSGLTQDGVIMGTPYYMSPEQAWGQTDVGPLADVYALGAILYALVTGRPPFQGPTALDTVMQLRENEPVPPTRLQPKIPKDLEAVCLAAIQKDPAQRYQSARDLADDLQRFQSGEPTKARPLGIWKRSYRWCLRNRVAALAIFLLIFLAIGGTSAAWAINWQRRNAVEARELAEVNEGKAKAAQELAEEKEGQAEAARKLAEENEEKATIQRSLAITTFHEIVERVPNLRSIPGTDEFISNFLLVAANGIDQVAAAQEPDERDFVIAKAHDKIGEGLLTITKSKPRDERQRHQAETARQQFRSSYRILERLAKTDKTKPQWKHWLNLGRSLQNIGYATERLDGAKAAVEVFLKSLDFRRKALEKTNDPLSCKNEIAETLGKLGELELGLGRPDAALEHLEEAAGYRRQYFEVNKNSAFANLDYGGALQMLGLAYRQLGQPDEAVAQLRKAIALFKRVAGAGIFRGQVNFAVGLNNLATTYLFRNETESANTFFQASVDRLEALRSKSPNDISLRWKLSQALYGLAHSERQMKRLVDSARSLERCASIRQELADTDAGDISFRQGLMFPLARLGQVKAAAEMADSLKKQAADDAENLYFVACCYALCAESQRYAPAVAESNRRKSNDLGSQLTPVEFENLALQTLREAIKNGYKGVYLMRVDPDLEPIRDHAEFQKILKELE